MQKIQLTALHVLIFVSWIALNISLTLYNKWLFHPSRFPFPLLTTITHQLVGFVLGLFSLGNKETLDILKKAWKPFCFLSAFVCTTIATNNMSLGYLHVSTVQIIKSMVPMFQIFTSKFVEGRSYPMYINAVIPVMCAGAAMFVFDNPDYNTIGCSLALASAVTQALHVSFSAVLVSDLKVNILVTWLYSCALSFLLLLLPFYFLEFQKVNDTKYFSLHSVGLLGIGMALAFMYNVACFAFIKHTSSLFSSSAGLFKTMLLILVSLFITPMQLHFMHYVGMLVVFSSFVLFGKMTFRLKQQSQAAVTDKDKATEKSPLVGRPPDAPGRQQSINNADRDIEVAAPKTPA